MDEEPALSLAQAIMRYEHIYPALEEYEDACGEVYSDDVIESLHRYVTYIIGSTGQSFENVDLSRHALQGRLEECYGRLRDCCAEAHGCLSDKFAQAERRYQEVVVANKGRSTIADKAKELGTFKREKAKLSAKLDALDERANRPQDYLSDDWSRYLGDFPSVFKNLKAINEEMLSIISDVEKERRDKRILYWTIAGVIVAALVGLATFRNELIDLLG